jgi:peptide/nickel transport system substrate-binding protein
MLRRTRSFSSGRTIAALTVVAALSIVATAAIPAAAGSSSGGTVDKAAVLRFGSPIEENGGVWFDPTGPRSGVAQNPNSRLWLDLIYDTMIHNTPDGQGEPGLATKWTTPDASTIELTLRQGVKYPDGAPFNAQVVKAAWDKLLASGRPNLTANVRALQSVEVVDDHTVRLHLNQPIAQTWVEDELKNSNAIAVPSPNATDLENKPVGAGPYQLESYTNGKIVLSKNPSFYDPKQQKLAKIEFDQVPFGAPGVAALQAGTVDLIWMIPPDSIDTIESAGFDVTARPSPRAFAMNLCPTQGVFASKEARQALQYAVDRDAINEGALNGTGAPTTTPLPRTSPFYNKSLTKTYTYNPKKAKALLKQAGVAPGTTVKALIPAVSPYDAIGEVVQSQLKDVGLNVEITKSTTFGADAQRAQPELTVVSNDPGLFANIYGGMAGALNVCGWKNDQLVAELNAARDASKPVAEQKQHWDAFQKLVLDDSQTVILNTQGLLAAHTKKVKGLDVINSPYGPQFNRVYMVK